MLTLRTFRTRQARKRERVRIAVLSIVSVIGISSVVGLIGWGLQTERLRVEDVVVQNTDALQAEDVEAAILRAFEKKHALVVPNDSVLFTGMGHVRDEVLATFPRIQEIDLRRAGTRTLTATVHERTPHALWCGDIVPEIAYSTSKEQTTAAEEAWGTCYLMDAESYIYARSPIFTGDVFMRYYGSLEGAEPIGQRFLTGEEFNAWEQFLSGLSEDGLRARALLILDERDCELYLDNGLRVLIPRTEDLAVVRDRLYSTLEEQAIDTERDIEYVDMRFGSKAFVRYVEIPQEGTE